MTQTSLIERITRSLAYMLRHKPEEFDIELDRHGAADLDEVIHVLNERLGEAIEEEDVLEAIESGDRPRYVHEDGRIRALYGHSFEVDPGEPSKPQELLYVGLSERDAERAVRYGLRAGRRAFLHLAKNEEEALETGRRQAREYAVVTVFALDAWEQGINFYDRGALFLSEPIPTEFLELGEVHDDGEPPQRERRGGERRRRDGDEGRRGGRSRGGRGGRGRRRDEDAEREDSRERDEAPARSRGRGEAREGDRDRDRDRDRDAGRDGGRERSRRRDRDGSCEDGEGRPRRDRRRVRDEERPAPAARREPAARTSRPAPEPAAAAPRPEPAGGSFGAGLFEEPSPAPAPKAEPTPEPTPEPRAERPAPTPPPAPEPRDSGSSFGAGL
jgi:putative RNA 2'-phosphotransferase